MNKFPRRPKRPESGNAMSNLNQQRAVIPWCGAAAVIAAGKF